MKGEEVEEENHGTSAPRWVRADGERRVRLQTQKMFYSAVLLVYYITVYF